jgi:NADH dehydrogenase
MILVTGATGFLGQHAVRRLVGAGEAVRCFCRPGSPGAEWLTAQSAEVVYGHLHDSEAMARACHNVRQVLHVAAPIREVRDTVVEQFHRQATACVAGAARRAGVNRFLMVSPMGCSATASLPYLRSCGVAEECVRGSGVPYVILQSSVMFGAGDRLISGIIRLLCRTSLLVIPGTGKTILQPIWVGDVVSCLVRALRDDAVVDRTIPIGGPQHLSYEEIADQIGTMLNVPRSKIHVSHRVVSLAGRLLEGLGRNPFLGYRHLEFLEVGTITALDAVKRAFGFQPMPLVEGVAYQLAPSSHLGRPWLTFGADGRSSTRTRHRV